MEEWLPGFTQVELDDAQDRYGLRFPPDLAALLLQRRPALGYAWNTEDGRIRQMLEWPLDMLLFDVEQGFWWPDWNERPATADERREVVASALRSVSRLIPLMGHRFIPELPHEAGNPIFSMHGFDTIYYGADLAQYFSKERAGERRMRPVRHIPFWSDIVENFDKAHDFYAASNLPSLAARDENPT